MQSTSGSDAVVREHHGDIDILEIFDLEQLQDLQDRFAEATGIASVITRPDGSPVTRPSNFCRLCSDVIRSTEKGLAACMHSDAIVGAPKGDGPTVRMCLSGGLWDAGASISVRGEHVANWLIGQVRTSETGDEQMLAFAREIGADEGEFVAALAEVPLMSVQRFRVIADFLFAMADQLSTSAYQNLEQARMLAEHERVAASLAHSEARYRSISETVTSFVYSCVRDPGGSYRVDWMAGAVEDVTGYRPEEILERGCWKFMVHPGDVRLFEENVTGLEPGHAAIAEFRVVTVGGDVLWLRSSASVAPDTAGTGTHRLVGSCEDITARRTAENALLRANERLEAVLKSITATMGKVVETRDPYTQGHERRVAQLSRQIAEEMGMGSDDIEGIETAALVHDVGKLSVPAEILTKPGTLSANEFELIKVHSQAGYDILKDIDFGWPVADVVLQHHERMDGSGYPAGSSGDDILMAARVLAVADVVEAMASHRPYRPLVGLEAAVAEISERTEKYDPEVAAAFARLHESGRIDL